MTTETTLAALRQPENNIPDIQIGFATAESYGLLKKIALDFSASDIVPVKFKDNPPNCMIALNMSLRMQADPLMVMQNLYVVHGTPSWSASFLIACFNQCGRFSPIRYKFEGERGTDSWGCRAVSSFLADGTPIEGTLVTIGVAKAEGWYSKNGSKWQTMPEQMLRYRAAAWMIRSTAPEIGMGFQTREEVLDTYDMQLGDGGTYEIQQSEISEVVGVSTPPEQPKAPAKPAQEKPKPEAPLDANAGKITCPKNNKLVDELDCPGCPNREGCPQWD